MPPPRTQIDLANFRELSTALQRVNAELVAAVGRLHQQHSDENFADVGDALRREQALLTQMTALLKKSRS